MMENFLAKAFSPLTILAKVIKKHGGDDFLAVLTVVFWVIGVVIALVIIPATATILFQQLSFVVGYLLTLYLYKKLDSYETDSDFLEFFFMISLGFIGGYTFGLMLFIFFLFY